MLKILFAIFAFSIVSSASASPIPPKRMELIVAGKGLTTNDFRFTGQANLYQNSIIVFFLHEVGIDPYADPKVRWTTWGNPPRNGLEDYSYPHINYQDMKKITVETWVQLHSNAPGFENDRITFFSDSTWACSGRCEISYFDYEKNQFVSTGERISTGRYKINTAPIPASLSLLGSGLALLALAARRRKARI